MKKLLTVTAVSVLLAVCAVLLVYFGFKYEGYEADVYERVTAYLILPLWLFSAVPAYVFTFDWLKDKSFAQGFWLGYVLGLFFPLLIAPVLAVIYFVSAIEGLIKNR